MWAFIKKDLSPSPPPFSLCLRKSGQNLVPEKHWLPFKVTRRPVRYQESSEFKYRKWTLSMKHFASTYNFSVPPTLISSIRFFFLFFFFSRKYSFVLHGLFRLNSSFLNSNAMLKITTLGKKVEDRDWKERKGEALRCPGFSAWGTPRVEIKL